MGKTISLKPTSSSKAEKQALKRRSLIDRVDAKFKGVGEPQISFLNYRLDLMHALNWFNVYASNIDKKKWTLASIEDKKQRLLLSNLDDSLFRQLGVLIRLRDNGQYLDDKELKFISDRISQLEKIATTPKEIKENGIAPKSKPIVTIDKNKLEAIQFACEIDGEIDEFIKSGYPRTFEFKNSVKTISGSAAKQVPPLYKPLIMEIEEALEGSCDQLNEAYSHVKTVQLKHFLKMLKDLISSCSQHVVSIRKPKVIKQKSPGELVKNLKYLPKFEELNIKSENPIKLVECQEVWLYDTVNRKLFNYKAVKDQKLSVHGTSISGFDVETSLVKSIRKPEVIKEFIGNKKDFAIKFSELTTRPQKPNGRTNANIIILKIFS
jgi:hypothetical protein